MSRVFRAPRIYQPIRTVRPIELLKKPSQPSVNENDVVTDAQKKAQAILENARLEAESVREQIVKKGYEQGYREGFTSSAASAQAILAEAQDALEAAKDSYRNMVKVSEPLHLALVVDATKRVIGESLKLEPERILSILRACMNVLSDESEFTVKVPPESLSLVESASQNLMKDFGAESFDVMADDNIESGVIVKTPHGFIDGTVGAQISNIAEALAQARNRLPKAEGS